jgi:hypothetical protein
VRWQRQFWWFLARRRRRPIPVTSRPTITSITIIIAKRLLSSNQATGFGQQRGAVLTPA